MTWRDVRDRLRELRTRPDVDLVGHALVRRIRTDYDGIRPKGARAMPRHFNDAISSNDLEHQRERDEWDRIENVVGFTDASIAARNRASCTDCGEAHDTNQMWYVPEGTRALCRRCRDLRVAGQRFIR